MESYPNATWPQTLAPNTVSPGDPSWASGDVSVDANSGSLDTSIPLPSYNPNVPALDLTYDSITANPLPIIIAENTLSASQAVPSQVSATLTFNGTVGTTYYYNTSDAQPRRRPADRAPGRERRHAGDRPVQLLGPDRRPRHHQHHDHAQRHGDRAQPVVERLRRRLDARRAGADHPGLRRRDPQPGRRRRHPLVRRQPRQRRRHLHHPGGRLLDAGAQLAAALTPTRCPTAPRSISTPAGTRSPPST